MQNQSRAQNGRPVQLICPCVVGRKDLMTKFYPAAVGDTTRTRVRQSLRSGRWCRHNRRCKPPPLTPGVRWTGRGVLKSHPVLVVQSLGGARRSVPSCLVLRI